MHEIEEFQAARQRRRDVGFLAALGLVLVVSVFAVVRSAYPPHAGQGTASGEIRAVDAQTLRRQLRSGRLSNHEAVHWRSVEAKPGTGQRGGAR
jgi:hypothetical protein